MENALELARKKKLDYISENGVNPYPDKYDVNYQLYEARDLPDGTSNVRIAGRITLMRKMGKMSFARVSDVYGSVQIAVKKDILGEQEYDFFRKAFDIGDFIGVCGEMFTTQTGEKTVRAQKIVFLGKALKPLPEKYHGLTDTDSRHRQRYLDLIMNEEVRQRFLLKFLFVREVRRYLEEHGDILKLKHRY